MSRHSSGQARVRLSGKTHYLGLWGTPEAHAAYAALVKDWLAAGRQPLGPRLPHAAEASYTIASLVGDFREYVESTGRYSKGGKPTSKRRHVFAALDSFSAFAGSVPILRLTEDLLILWRDRIEADKPNMTRTGINKLVCHVLRAIAWGRQRKVVPASVARECAVLQPLKLGECGNRPERGRPRRALTDDEIEAVQRECSAQVQDLMRLQLATAARPGEVCAIRWADVDKNGPLAEDGTQLWIYRVRDPKTAHRDRSVTYLLNATAQEVLKAQPKALPTAPIFPAPRLRGPWKTVCFTQHIHDACVRAGVTRFSAHELRHTGLSRVCASAGIAAACAAASHSDISTTARHYLHRDEADAIKAAAALDRRTGS